MAEEVPKVFEYGLRLYEEIASNAIDGVFTGSKTAAFRNLGISQSYYSKLYRTLQELGCIEMLQRGSGEGIGRNSVIRVHEPPTEDTFFTVYQTTHRQSLDIAGRLDIVEQKVQNVEGRTPDIDLNRYILSFEQRLTDIDTRLTEIESRLTSKGR
jgi:DNA-binding IscR family transcriptional regulator